MAQCKLCPRNYKRCGSNTSTLLRHLRNKHPDQIKKVSNQPKIEEFITPSTVKYPNKSLKKKMIDKKVALFVAKDLRPPAIVEGEGFKELISELDPRYVLPSRRKLVRDDLPALQNKVREGLHRQLENTHSLSLTTDLWTSVSNTGFIALTAHFLDNEKNLQAKLIGCESFTERHSSINILEKLKEMMAHFKIEEKVVGCTTDNGANIVKAVKDLGVFHIPCLAHKLNLCAVEVLSKSVAVKDARDKIAKLVSAFRSSSNVKREFRKCQERLGIDPPKALLADVQTRWNSTYLMLERALELREAITLFQGSDEGAQFFISGETWAVLKSATALLRPLFEATVEMSSERNTTGSKIIPLAKSLMSWYASEADRLLGDPISHEFCQNLSRTIYNRFKMVEDVEELALATLCDPRFKKQGFRDPEKASATVRRLKERLSDTRSPEQETTSGLFLK